MSNVPSTGGAASNVFSPRGSHGNGNRYHLASSAGRTPRVFPPDVRSIPLSPSRLESPMFRERVSALMQQGDTYAKRLDGERRRSHDLDLALRSLRTEHFRARKALCDATNAQLCAATTELKPLRTLENRLDKVLTRYNEVCNANKALREQIQALRREKVQQGAVLDKLERETAQAQAEATQMAQASQAAGDARDRANRQSEALRRQLNEDGDDFEAGWREKTGQLAEDRATIRDIPRLRTPKSPSRPHFLNSSATPESSSSPMASSGASRPLPGAFKLLSTPDVKLRDETQKTEWLLQEKASDLHKQSERLRTAQEGLAKIKRKTGEKDPQVLVATLLAAEEKNFSLFNMINELSTEMEALEVENNGLEAQVLEQTRDGSTGSAEDAHRRALKQQLEDQIDKSRQKVARLEARYSEAAEATDVMKAGALALFHKLQHPSDEAFAAQVAQGLTDVTMAQLLGIIEQRVGELVDIHNIATNAPAAAALGAQQPRNPSMKADSHDATGHARISRNGDRPRGGLATAAAGSGGVLLRPTPPTAEDFGDSDNDEPQQDDVLRPCKISEIQEKTASAVGRRKEKQVRAKR